MDLEIIDSLGSERANFKSQFLDADPSLVSSIVYTKAAAIKSTIVAEFEEVFRF